MNMELMKAGYPPIDIKFTDRFSYNNAFDEYHVKHNLGAMEKLFAGYVNKRLDSYFEIFARIMSHVLQATGFRQAIMPMWGQRG